MSNSDKKSYLSDVEIKEFWEWCGFTFKHEEIVDASACKVFITTAYFNDIETQIPDLDLNNLFKYAVPKLRDNYQYELVGWNEGQHKAIINKLQKGWAETYTTAIDKDPDLALFWAIWEVLKKDGS